MDAQRDADRGEVQEPRKLPLDNLNAKLDLADGVFKFDPVDFGVAGGK